SAQIREILISESAWEEMTCLFAPSLACVHITQILFVYLSFLINTCFDYYFWWLIVAVAKKVSVLAGFSY
ncbi:hypothetical protein POW94_22005, partial [Enterobacter asburiae]